MEPLPKKDNKALITRMTELGVLLARSKSTLTCCKKCLKSKQVDEYQKEQEMRKLQDDINAVYFSSRSLNELLR